MHNGNGNNPWLKFEGIEIDIDGHRLRVDGVDKPLERKAFAVLALLAGHPGRAFTRQEILDAVWGHAHVTPGVLNRIVTLIRQALGESAETHRYLHTVHGVGYRFDLPLAVADVAALQSTISNEVESAATPATLTDTQGLPAEPTRVRRVRTTASWAIVLLLLLALAVWSTWTGQQSPQTSVAATQPERSIAVLPLINAGGKSDQQFFSDGLSEDLIKSLSKFQGLKVIGHLSSFRFRDSKEDSKTIGSKLGVEYLVGGSVRRVDDAVRVRAELISTKDGRILWSESFDRPYKDLFALQDEIARAISNALQAKLLSSPTAASQSDRPPGGNIDAYNAYLQGLQNFYLRNIPKAIEFQETAIRLDPQYASALAQLSVNWTMLGQFGDNGPDASRQYFHNARMAVDKALTLEPNLGLAHCALGSVQLAADMDWKSAIAQFRRGLQLSPDSSQSYGGFSWALAVSGKLHESIEQRQQFISREPLFAGNYFQLADLQIAVGQLDNAEKSVRIGMELQPEPTPHFQFTKIAIIRNNADAALQAARQPGDSDWEKFFTVLAMQIAKDRTAADSALADFVDHGDWAKNQPYQMAQIYAIRGESDQTLEWLKRTWAKRDPNIQNLLYDPLILRFRDDPRLAALCKEVGLPSPADSDALSMDQIRALPVAKH